MPLDVEAKIRAIVKFVYARPLVGKFIVDPARSGAPGGFAEFSTHPALRRYLIIVVRNHSDIPILLSFVLRFEIHLESRELIQFILVAFSEFRDFNGPPIHKKYGFVFG